MIQYDQYIYDIFFQDKNLDCVQIHGTENPKEIFETVGYDYNRMWNDDFESLKEDGWGWANKYFQDEETITDYFNLPTEFFDDIKKGHCDNKVGFKYFLLSDNAIQNFCIIYTIYHVFSKCLEPYKSISVIVRKPVNFKDPKKCLNMFCMIGPYSI